MPAEIIFTTCFINEAGQKENEKYSIFTHVRAQSNMPIIFLPRHFA